MAYCNACVLFPSLCVGAASADFQDLAASTGFPEGLCKTPSGEDSLEVSFLFFWTILENWKISFTSANVTTVNLLKAVVIL